METELFIQWCPKQQRYVLMLAVVQGKRPAPAPNTDVLADLYANLWDDTGDEISTLELMDRYNQNNWSYFILKANPDQVN